MDLNRVNKPLARCFIAMNTHQQPKGAKIMFQVVDTYTAHVVAVFGWRWVAMVVSALMNSADIVRFVVRELI